MCSAVYVGKVGINRGGAKQTSFPPCSRRKGGYGKYSSPCLRPLLFKTKTRLRDHLPLFSSVRGRFKDHIREGLSRKSLHLLQHLPRLHIALLKTHLALFFSPRFSLESSFGRQLTLRVTVYMFRDSVEKKKGRGKNYRHNSEKPDSRSNASSLLYRLDLTYSHTCNPSPSFFTSSPPPL